jgi:hypothetical protein
VQDDSDFEQKGTSKMTQCEIKWHPIESSPTDGSFLITDGCYIAEVFPRGKGFSTTADGFVFEGATHWMPSPALPNRM